MILNKTDCFYFNSQFCKSSYSRPLCWFPLSMQRYRKTQQNVPLLFIIILLFVIFLYTALYKSKPSSREKSCAYANPLYCMRYIPLWDWKWRHCAGPSKAVRHGGGRRTKNLQGERERKGRERGKERKKKKEKRKEKRERKGEKSKRCFRPMGVKHPLRTVKRL